MRTYNQVRIISISAISVQILRTRLFTSLSGVAWFEMPRPWALESALFHKIRDTTLLVRQISWLLVCWNASLFDRALCIALISTACSNLPTLGGLVRDPDRQLNLRMKTPGLLFSCSKFNSLMRPSELSRHPRSRKRSGCQICSGRAWDLFPPRHCPRS